MENIVHLLFIWILSFCTSSFSEYYCPTGAKIDRDGLHCYWMPAFTSTWLGARGICQRENEGDLAMVDSVTVQTFIQNSFQMDSSVWVWLRNRMGQGLFENSDATACTSMALATGQWMNEICDNGNFIICQRKISVSLPSSESYVTGVPLMSAIYKVSQIQLLPSPPDPGQRRVEIMMFPGLWFSHEGQVMSLDLVTQPSDQVTFARVQILRPYCSPTHHLVPPGCSSLLNAFSCCSTMPMCNTTGGCVSGQYWCHLLEICLPVTSPCSPYNSSNRGRVFTLPPRYPAASPFFHLMADIALELDPSADHTYISVTVQDKDITVYPDDILAVQHTRRAGDFLHCVDGTSSAWRQSYLSMHGPEWGGWLEGSLSAQSGKGQWLDGLVCDIRVIYEDTMAQYGVPTIPSSMQTTMQTKGPNKIQSLVTGLQVLYPKLDKNIQTHVAVNIPTLVVIKIASGVNATSSWAAPVYKNGVLFHSYCPAEMPEAGEGCMRSSPDMWFSHVYMMLSDEGEYLLNITASNSLNSQSLTVSVVAHIPVTGLSIQPQGFSRVLVDIPQLFTASVATGSSVRYTWVIDGLAQFPHIGKSYSVVFKKPAEYKLKVIGSNPVSSQLIELKITADLMTPLADLTVISMPEVIAAHISSIYTIQVKADISIGVTIRWDFGDNTTSASHPVSSAIEMKDSYLHKTVKHIYLQDSAHHTYSFPGDYTLKIEAYNKYDHIEKDVTVRVRTPLSRLMVSSSHTICQVNCTILFEVSPWPSSYGVLYSWNFGDDSSNMKEYSRKVSHVFKRPGTYNVTVWANNTLSVLTNYTAVQVVKFISGLQLNFTSYIELNSIFEIIGKVSSGTHLKWTFDFGDGSILKDHSESSASHIYKSPGNYTVHVIAYNGVSKEHQSVNVEVFKLIISNILPLDCIVSKAEIDFFVLVKGYVPLLTFHWDFGDKTPSSVVKGTATIKHSFLNSGTYTVGVNAYSPVGSAHYQTSICVQDRITDVVLQSAKSTVAVGEEICFNVSVTPKFKNYMFWWNHNFSIDTPIIGLSHHCFVFTEEGFYEMTVLAGNKVCNKTAKTSIFVQKSISNLSIQYEGNHVALIVNHPYNFWAELCGKIADFQWDFGDGSSKTKGQNQSHIFPFPGRFRVTVTASNAVSSDSVSIEVEVQAPLSYLMVNTSQPFAEAGTEVLIKAQTDFITYVKFYWTVTSLSPPKLGTSEFWYVFPKAGVFQIKVTAQNLVSLLETTLHIEVIERIHGVQILCDGLRSARYFLTNQTLVLRASVAHGSNLTYEWQARQNMINRIVSDSEQFQLFTSSPGDIYVRLVVSNVIGSIDSELSLRAVEFVSGVSISVPVNVVTKDTPVTISVNVTSGTDLQYLWFLGSESVISDVPFILHTFKVIGVVNLRVSVSNVFGSIDATKLLSVQENISEVDFTINGQSKPFFVTSNSLLFLKGTARKGNVLHWEWVLTFSNNTVIFLADSQTVSYSSVDVSDHHVLLNASNDISWQTVSYIVLVQDPIQGLSLTASNSVVCESDPVIFQPFVSRGSDVFFTLEFVNESSSVDIQQNFTTSSLSVGNHLVKAIARNNVSYQTAVITLQVVEKIQDLHLIGCCSAVLEALKNVTFQASGNSDSQVNYYWTFVLNGVYSSQEMGRNVHFTPITNGSLSITLKADNGFCSQSLSVTATVQRHVRKVKLLSSHDKAFMDYPINFIAITDGGSDLKFIWDFGEPSGGTLVTESNIQDHIYNVTGRFVVHVTAFNNISQISTQMTIDVQKLECTRPHIYIVGQSKVVKSRSSLFEAKVDLRGCISHKAFYLWEISKGPNCSATDKVSLNDSIDVTTPLLLLPKHTLTVGNYCLTFTTGLQGTPIKHHKTIDIVVLHSQLVALIKGGSHRIWSNQNDLILDATESYDPDSKAEDMKLFRFLWDYHIENTTSSSAAFFTLHSIPRNGNILLFPRSALFPGKVYHFTLTLYKGGRQSVSASQSVTVYDTPLLPVAVKCTSCYSLSSFHLSHSQYIALAGQCSSVKDTVQYTWTAENHRGEALSLNEITTTTGSLHREIVIRPGVLIEDHKYTFTLNVSESSSGLWGSASITLVPNRPPYGGICTLSPDDSIHFLETRVCYSCSGWMDDDDGESAQLIFSLQVAQCEDFGPLCPLITLYRGPQSTFGSLVPLGNPSTMENRSVIHVLVKVEDSMGASVITVRKKLTVQLSAHHSTEWLRNTSQWEFRGLLQQGNPQDIIQYSIALTSQLNQLKTINPQEIEDKIQMRGVVTQALASLPISSIQNAAQISSALSQSTVIPSEVRCESCHGKVLKVTEKMIKVMREQTEQSDIDPTETGRNILNVISSTLTADHIQRSNSGLKQLHTSKTAKSALSQISELMRILMMSRMPGEEALSLVAPKINAMGVRGDPTKDLLCADPFSHCQFYVPSALSSQLKEENQEVVQIFLKMEADENPFIPAAEPPISTVLAAMEFATTQGQPIPIANLTPDTAIEFTLHSKIREMDDERLHRKKFTLTSMGSFNFTVKAVETDPQAGLYISLNFSLIPESGVTASGQVWISVSYQSDHLLSQLTLSKSFTIALSSEPSSLEHTIFLTPLLNGSAKDLFVNLSSSIGTDVSVSTLLFSTLCRFFNADERHWSGKGLRALSGSTLDTAHCLTQHLTMFGASLFVQPGTLLLLPPSDEPVRNIVVGIVCGVLLLIHLLVGLIAHKLDHLESLRLCCVPLCGQKGRYQYRILVKTGWNRGSGTTAHVGISLYGLNKSGSRHLQREGAFQRNGLDDFQIETDACLGEIWKIRIWHDNTGLDPSWYLQHVIVWDIQTDNMFFFLVEDWLSVENEKNSGRVEKVVLASCPQELQQFKRVLQAQLLFGFREHHLWISLWERPPHSTFSRAQRVTCCSLLLHLYLGAGAVWYGAVGTKVNSGPVSTQMLMSAETILVGMTMAALMFPLQTILRFLFQKTKSKMTLELSLPPSPVSHTVEMDVFFNRPDLSCSSFLSLPNCPDSSMYDGPSPFTNSMQSKNLDSEFWNASDPENDRSDLWPSCDSIFGLPELVGGTHFLKRKKALLQLRLSTPTSDHNTLEPTKSPEEDLRSVSADMDATNTLSSEQAASDSGHFTPNETTLSDDQDSLCSDWSDLSLDGPSYEPGLQKSYSTLSMLSVASTFLPSLPPDSTSTTSNTRIGVVRGVPGFTLPSWVLRVVYLLVAVLLGTCLALVGLYGSRFSSSVVLMWLVSTLSAFLTSSLLLEPFAICVQALYMAAVVRAVDPEVEERLAQETEVRRNEEDIGDKVHPLCGYGLLQAKEEARKLRTLRGLIRNCLVYMLFLLVVLMVNYQENVQEKSSRLLHSSIKHTLISASPEQPGLTALSGWMNAQQWIDKKLLSHLYENPTLSLIGLPRLQKIHSRNFCSQNIRDLFQSGRHPLMLASYVSSHANPGHQRSSEASMNTPALLTWPVKDVSCTFDQREEVLLGNSSESARRILSELQTANWMTTGTQTVLIEFTQYHKETSILAPISILLDQTQTGRIFALISIQPFHVSQSSVPDLHITLTVLLLVFALCFLGAEIWAMIKKPRHYLWQTWCWFQLLLALLTLAAAVLRLYFLTAAEVGLSRHRSQPDSFTDFQSAASLAKISSQTSAVLLTLLVLKMVGILRFVRRWLVLGQVIRQVFPQICTVVFLLLLLFLLFAHTGIMLFSSSVKGFRTLGQASHSLLCLLRGRNGRHRLYKHHPVVGPLYCLCAVGIAFWVVGRLCAAILIRTYRIVQADIYRPSMEPQDYEMVQFLIKRLKLWMGLSKTKEFRHRVKFEGMVPPPSRSSQGSQASNLSTAPSPTGPRQSSSASLASDSTVNSDSFGFNLYVDRLVPCVNSLLTSFDRVNQLTEEVYNFELQFHEVQKRISQKRTFPQRMTSIPGHHGCALKLPLPAQTSSTSLLESSPSLPSLQGIPKIFPHRRCTHSESSVLAPGSQFSNQMLSALYGRKNSANSGNMGVPGRRAWNSVTCHSADTAQRLPGSQRGVTLPIRPRSEEGEREQVHAGMPIKKQAWHIE